MKVNYDEASQFIKDKLGIQLFPYQEVMLKAFCDGLSVSSGRGVGRSFVADAFGRYIAYEATVEDVKQLYMYAWERHLKGITVYRAGCKRAGILNADTKKTDEHPEMHKTPGKIQRGMIMDVPDDLTYRKYKLSTGCGKLYLFVGIEDTTGTIYDFFTNTDGVGGCTVNTQAVSRLLSACVRGGVPIEYAIEQLQKAGTCPSFQYARGKGKKLSAGKSCASAIANVLSDLLKELAAENGEDMREPELQAIKNGTKHTDEPVNKCPVCGAELVAEGGCNICKACGYDKCDQ